MNTIKTTLSTIAALAFAGSVQAAELTNEDVGNYLDSQKDYAEVSATGERLEVPKTYDPDKTISFAFHRKGGSISDDSGEACQIVLTGEQFGEEGLSDVNPVRRAGKYIARCEKEAALVNPDLQP